MSDSVQHNEFLYALLRSKMNTAKPSILLHASTEHSLVMDPKSTIEQYVQQALHIAHRVQTATGIKREALPSEQQAQQPHPKTNRTQTPNPSSEPKWSVPPGSDLSSGRVAALSKMKDDRVLQEFSRCTLCVWLLKDGRHPDNHPCDLDNRHKRVKGMSKEVNMGHDPNSVHTKNK